jgi:hypothetical protein
MYVKPPFIKANRDKYNTMSITCSILSSLPSTDKIIGNLLQRCSDMPFFLSLHLSSTSDYVANIDIEE